MDKLLELKAQMEALIEGAKNDDRDLTADEAAKVESLVEQFNSEKAARERSAKSAATVAALTITEVDGATFTTETREKATTPGDAFVKSAGFNGFASTYKSGVSEGTPVRIPRVEMGVKAGEFLASPRVTETVVAADASLIRPLTLLDLVTYGQTTSNTLEFVSLGAPDNAAIVAEGTLKPNGILTAREVTANARTYAAGVTVSNQSITDHPMMKSIIDTELRKSVQSKVEDMILNGSGTGTEPLGILNTTGTHAVTGGTDALASITAALEAIEASQGTPNAIVMNPADVWSMIRAAGNAQGNFFSGNLFSGGPSTIAPFGVPVVKSAKVAKGTIVVGDFSSVHLFERDALTVEAFNQHLDYAQRNLVYVRAEMRAIQAVLKPGHLAVVTS